MESKRMLEMWFRDKWKEKEKESAAMARVNRRVLNPIIGERFAVYGIEEKDKFGNWIEKFNFTDKGNYNNWISSSWNTMGKMEKVGDWESYPEL